MPPTTYSTTAIFVSLETAAPSSFKVRFKSCVNMRFVQRRTVLANPEDGFMSV